MKNRRLLIATLLLGALLAAGLGWQRHEASLASAGASESQGVPSASAPAANGSGMPSGTQPAGASAASWSGALPPAPAQPVLSGRQLAELQLTRQLAGEHRFLDEGRAFQVIGSKETVDASGASATMVLIVDETSGQIRYHLPGLQFSLRPGVDPEAFISEHPRLRRLFVNPIYAQVAVDAAELAEQFRLLRQDPRVDKLRLMTREPVRTPK